MASPQLQALIEQMRAAPPMSSLELPELRQTLEAMAEPFALENVAVEAVDSDGVQAEWVGESRREAERTLLYLHGGGYAIGSRNTHRHLAGRLAHAAQARALVVDYRLAPEHPFPAAVDDAVAAYRWLLKRGIAPERTVFAGDSAGGGLVVATALALREAGDALPAGLVCLSPWVDLELSGASMEDRALQDPLLDRALLERFVAFYLGERPERRNPLASPLFGELGGLPPLLIQVGGAEILFDDAVRLAERARAAGVETTLEPWEDLIHIWHFYAPMLPEAEQAIERIGSFVRERTGAATR